MATAALTQNLYVDPWIMTDSPPHSAWGPDNPFHLRAVARRVRGNIFRSNRLERFQTFLRETLSRCLLDTRDDILSDVDWLEEDWDLAD